MSDYIFFSKDPGCWGESYQSLWGCHDICLLLQWFHIAQVTQSELTSLTHLKVWGESKRFHSNVAFLLVLPKEGVAEKRVYGHAMVWVHPYQARVSTLGGAAKQLATWPPLGPTGPMPWCSSIKMPTMCPSLKRVTWVSWLRNIPAMSPMERSSSWRSANSWAQVCRWFTWRDSMDVRCWW